MSRASQATPSHARRRFKLGEQRRRRQPCYVGAGRRALPDLLRRSKTRNAQVAGIGAASHPVGIQKDAAGAAGQLVVEGEGARSARSSRPVSPTAADGAIASGACPWGRREVVRRCRPEGALARPSARRIGSDKKNGFSGWRRRVRVKAARRRRSQSSSHPPERRRRVRRDGCRTAEAAQQNLFHDVQLLRDGHAKIFRDGQRPNVCRGRAHTTRSTIRKWQRARGLTWRLVSGTRCCCWRSWKTTR